VVVPAPSSVKVNKRRWYRGQKEHYRPFAPGKDLVPPMVRAGEDYRVHISGLTHDERGYPVINAACQSVCVSRLIDKIKGNVDDITILAEDQVEDADVLVVSYGISYRVATRAIDLARRKGIRVGSVRLVTIWPFPEPRIVELAKKVKCMVMPEINMGQVFLEMDRCAGRHCRTRLVPHCGGWVHDPQDILAAIVEGAKG
jgi:2-oxoglutarate ferredoxin oxidoreductase subunit alpha